MTLVGVEGGSGLSQVMLRHLRLHTWVRDIALEVLLQFFPTADTSFLHHCCMIVS